MAYNTNLTTASGLSAEMQTYYDRQLLESMKPKLVHYEYAQKRPYKRQNGKMVSFRKWTPFPAVTTALTEGVIPDGQALESTEITTTVAGYGGYVAVSDLLDLTAIDPVISDAVDLMADQGALSVDTLIRDALHSTGTNVMYANGKAGRSLLLSTDVLSTADIRKAARLLKKNKALPFVRGGKSYYVAIVGPDTTYDLQSDELWQDVAKYQDAEAIFSGEIGRLFGVIFVETSEAKVNKPAALPGNVNGLLHGAASGSYNAGTKTLTLAEPLTSEQATAFASRKVSIGITADYTDVVASAVAGVAGQAKLVLTTGYTGEAAELDGREIRPGEASTAATLVLGQNAYGVVDIEGSSRPRAVVKTPGDSGTSDPLEQISTVGWKVDAFAVKVLQQGFMVRIEHGISG